MTTIAQDIFLTTFETLTSITREESRKQTTQYAPNDPAKATKQPLTDSLERLVLWRDAIGHSGITLDEVLLQSTELRSSTMTALFQLACSVYGLITIAQLSPDADDPEVQPDRLYNLLSTAYSMIESDPTSFEDCLAFDSEIGREELLDDLDTYINCLLDLSVAFRSLLSTKEEQIPEVGQQDEVDPGSLSVIAEDTQAPVDELDTPRASVHFSTGQRGLTIRPPRKVNIQQLSTPNDDVVETQGRKSPLNTSCSNCGKTGHWARDCLSLKKGSAAPSRSSASQSGNC